MAVMFHVAWVSFGMLMGEDHFTLKRITVKWRRRRARSDVQTEPFDADNDPSSSFPTPLEHLDWDICCPLEGTTAGVCAKTLRKHYTPPTSESLFAIHHVFHQQGLCTVLATPILVNGNKCAGVILLSHRDEDAFSPIII